MPARYPHRAWSRALIALLVAVCASGSLRSETVVIEAGSSMTYLANTSDPGVDATWFLDSFVEGPEWSGGVYGVGYDQAPIGSGAHDLLQTTVPGPVQSIYTRATFQVADVSAVTSVFLGLDYDDGVVAWVNGVEVYRSPEMRGRPLLWNTTSIGSHESSNGSAPDYEPLRNITAATLPALQNGTNLLAVGVWNDSPGSDDLVLVPRLSGNRELTRAPYLQKGSSGSITVRWRTATPSDSVVLYGDQPGNLTGSVTIPGPTTEHEVDVSGLDPNTRYHYAVGNGSEILAGDDADHFFVTAPTTGVPKPTRAWILGDSGQGTLSAEAVRDAYYDFTNDAAGGGADARHTDLWLMLGDNAYPTGTDLNYQENLFDIYPEVLRTSVLWPTIGNHDSFDPDAQEWPYYLNFSMPTGGEAGGIASGNEAYYSFDYGNIHFVVLDSMDIVPPQSDAMLTWLAADLADTTQEWIVAYFHHPPYSKGGHDSDDPADSSGRLVWMRENAVPVLESHGVDLVLAGHSHSFERSFLLDGHYGDSTTFLESMKVDAGSGDADGPDGAYMKPLRSASPGNDGAVYTVAGSSSFLSPGVAIDLGGTEPNHPAMYVSMLTLGSVVLDVDGTRLDARFLDDAGVVQDRYTIFHGAPPQPPVAAFDAAPLEGLAPLTVTFTDTSQNGPTVWSWDFQDDGAGDSNQPSPSHEFTQVGHYSVRLAVTNSAGSDEALEERFVCVTNGVPGGVATLRLGPNPHHVSWTPVVDATAYDLVRGGLADLKAAAGDFTSIDLTCLVDDGAEVAATDSESPFAGAAFFYLARATNCIGEDGTYDAVGPGLAASRDTGLDVCSVCPDGDGDGVCDADDGCPTDPGKTEPGVCGCGSPDVDTDGDGALDCEDGCPADPDKTDPGICDCGVPDVDTDGDGAFDCEETCDDDPDKTEPGVCGCGIPDDDTDSDGALDCEETCDFDPNKTEPGQCGCGNASCWVGVSSGTPFSLESVDFPVDDLVGFAAGSAGTVIRTMDGGNIWLNVSPGVPVDLETITFPVDAVFGWVVGEGGTILRTQNAGVIWTPQFSGTLEDLLGIQFLDGMTTAIVVGDTGTILKTIDGGMNWVAKPSGTTAHLESVDFPGGGPVGYVVGRDGVILKSLDAGETWAPLSSGTTVDLEDVQFPVDALTGYAVGDNGTLLKTTDGGQVWTAQNPLLTTTLRGIDFPENALEGIVVGSAGRIRRTENGGASWIVEDSGTTSTLRDIRFVDTSGAAFAVGSSGVIRERVVE